MQKVQAIPAAALGAVVLLCAAVSASVGLGPLGWATGGALGVGLAVLLQRQPQPFGPANAVTTARAVLACVVAALAADGLRAEAHTALIVALGATALVLDAVDGKVARRTGSATKWGARYDMEVDAFLIAVLSLHVASQTHWWVVAIGAMRYVFVAASRLLPWLSRPSPPRYLAKVIAATQGVVLVVAASQLLPEPWVTLALAAALALLLESFGHQTWWLWRHRHDADAAARFAAQGSPQAPAWLVTAGAVVLLWLALAPPGATDGFAAVDLLRIPAEGLALVAVALLLPRRPRQVVAVLAGLVAAALVVVRVLGLGFDAVLDRPFHVLDDWSYLPKGVEVLQATDGDVRAATVVVAAIAAALLVVVALPWAAGRTTQAAAARPRRSWQLLAALTATWVACAALGGPAGHVAAAGSTRLTADSVSQIRSDFRDHAVFRGQIQSDDFASRPADDLLAGLRGKDVLLVWVESYGRVALEDPDFAPGIVEVLEDGDRRLASAGYDVRSAYLTSPTFGAASWLAHATLQSGLWVDSERRYRQLLGSDRRSLTSAFGEAGWRTVFTVPANTRDWPEGAAYYGFDRLYDSRDVGYAGPQFGYASMPDQYTLEHFRRTELAPADRPPVFAEIDLISSHHPWAPLPDLVPWEDVGDGSVFRGMPERGEESVDGRADPATAQRLYGDSIEYTWRTLLSFLETHPDPDRVVILAGDHQPHSFVSGDDPGHDVPVTVLSQDPDAMDRITGWGWEPRLHPSPDAPVWRMDELRDELFDAYDTPRR